MIIAIDGPAGSGKSSTAKAVAEKLAFQHVDTGAMYRVVTLKALREGIPCDDHVRLGECVRNTQIRFEGVVPSVAVIMDGEDVSREIRSSEVTSRVSDYCAPLVVREDLVRQQREIAANHDSVCEGRDMGTVVFPEAELKIFMIASVDVRAMRRQKDFEALGVIKTVEELIQEIEERDFKDSNRENSPLVKAADAIVLDTTNCTFEKQVEWIAEKVSELRKQ